jgi:hypothetical protein
LLKKKQLLEACYVSNLNWVILVIKREWFLSELIRILNAAVLRIDAPVGGGRIL